MGRSQGHKVARSQGQQIGRVIGIGLVCMSLCATAGCESLQRKFTRKPKHPAERPTPIIHFEDYSKAMTPLDRYRKHALLFEHWNSQLIDALTEKPSSFKRVRHSSGEAMGELEVLHQLLDEEAAKQLEPIVVKRRRLDERLQDGTYMPGEMMAIQRMLERQARRIKGEFFWRKVEDRLRGDQPGDAEGL